ncbi:uncharacterized protein LOC119073814 [Bradysia coprophila]|uniref:uncharacterized protein LOC119073814 n=1 Tax=Bradysia coprophila TaxID=38358 RepID=UPI00187DD694|nr:uncharacterized protein LOC119073814 [Bradysia coprophila]
MSSASQQQIKCPPKVLVNLAEWKMEISSGKSVTCKKIHSMDDEEVSNLRPFALLWVIYEDARELHDIAKDLFDKFEREVKNFEESVVGKMCIRAMDSYQEISIAELTATIRKMEEFGELSELTEEFKNFLGDKKIEEEEERKSPKIDFHQQSYAGELKFCAPQPYAFRKIFTIIAENQAIRKIFNDFVLNMAEEELKKRRQSTQSNSSDQLSVLLQEKLDSPEPENAAKQTRDKYAKSLWNLDGAAGGYFK